MIHAKSLSSALLAAFLTFIPTPGAAQDFASAPEPVAPTRESAARGPDSRNQLALEVGILSAGLSYARRLGESPWSVGAGVWGAWEPPNTFDRPIFEPLGVTVFGRYRPAAWLHADLGVMGASYRWADDCSGCSGSFTGVRAAVLAGKGIVYVGPEVAAGWASDDRDGTELGLLWGVQARLVLGWD